MDNKTAGQKCAAMQSDAKAAIGHLATVVTEFDDLPPPVLRHIWSAMDHVARISRALPSVRDHLLPGVGAEVVEYRQHG